jgi:hypothetical protein
MRRGPVAVAVGLLVLATPAVTWWILGDLSEDVPDPDYMYRPPRLSDGQEMAIGIAATAVALVSIGVVIAALRRRAVTSGEVLSAAPLLLAAAFCGFAWRVMTAGVIGANIGGGMVLLFGPFVLIGLAVWSGVWWRSARRAALR